MKRNFNISKKDQLLEESLIAQIEELESLIPVYKQLGQYHPRFHAENEIQNLKKQLKQLQKIEKNMMNPTTNSPFEMEIGQVLWEAYFKDQPLTTSNGLALLKMAKALAEFFNKKLAMFQKAGVNYTKSEMEIMRELLNAQEGYIKFLSDEITSTASFLYAHGMKPTEEVVERGKQLREKIKLAKSQLVAHR